MILEATESDLSLKGPLDAHKKIAGVERNAIQLSLSSSSALRGTGKKSYFAITRASLFSVCRLLDG